METILKNLLELIHPLVLDALNPETSVMKAIITLLETLSSLSSSPTGSPPPFAVRLLVLFCWSSGWFTGVFLSGWAPGGVGCELPPPRRVFRC